MAKNSTHISCASFLAHNEKDLPAGQAGRKEKAEPGLAPCEAVIQNILNFSKALRVKKSHGVGIVEFVLN
jgi:hypothetical protein